MARRKFASTQNQRLQLLEGWMTRMLLFQFFHSLRNVLIHLITYIHESYFPGLKHLQKLVSGYATFVTTILAFFSYLLKNCQINNVQSSLLSNTKFIFLNKAWITNFHNIFCSPFDVAASPIFILFKN